MSTYIPTWLYVKQHNQTKLKYFGCTTCDNPIQYKGSGNYWRRHLKIHGNDVSTIWCQLFNSETEIYEYAIAFSKENNIVESKEWANLIIEEGINGSVKGRTVSDETRTKMSIAKKGKPHGPMSNEQKDKISKSLKGKKGKPHSTESKRKISEVQKGKKHSEYTKKKMSASHKGKIVSENTRQKISAIHKGKTVSSETRKRMSLSLKGLKRSDATKQRMVELGKQKRWWTNGEQQTLSVVCPDSWYPGRLR